MRSDCYAFTFRINSSVHPSSIIQLTTNDGNLWYTKLKYLPLIQELMGTWSFTPNQTRLRAYAWEEGLTLLFIYIP